MVKNIITAIEPVTAIVMPKASARRETSLLRLLSSTRRRALMRLENQIVEGLFQQRGPCTVRARPPSRRRLLCFLIVAEDSIAAAASEAMFPTSERWLR